MHIDKKSAYDCVGALFLYIPLTLYINGRNCNIYVEKLGKGGGECMTELTKKLILIALSQVENVKRATLAKIYQLEELPVHIGAYSVQKIMKILGVSESVAQHIKAQFSLARAEEMYGKLKEQGGDVLLIDDPRYSRFLKEIYDPPLLLYGIGDFQLLSRYSIAVIGSRTPTPYGRNNARTFAEFFSKAGFCIVSGLARGIDSEAHWGALQGKGGTIGVLGGGVDYIYPKENRKLYYEIIKHGLLLSEYPPGVKPERRYFPERNRIISGLSLGILVVESALRSGTHITADAALEQGRDVFAIPGSIHSSRSAGCHHLISEGAKLVQCPEDVLSHYSHYLSEILPEDVKQVPSSSSVQLTFEEAEILAVMGWEPISFEKIYQRFPLPSSQLHHLLLSLQVKKCIERLPGPSYLRLKT